MNDAGKSVRLYYLALVLIMLFTLFATATANAAPKTIIQVNTTTDVVNPSDGLCSLREAIVSANTNFSGGGAGECAAGTAGADAVNFSVSLPATITLVSALPQITEELTITGPGASFLAVSGANTYRVFSLASNILVNFNGITIRDGVATGDPAAYGGGIFSSNTSVALTSVSVISNTAQKGGGMYAEGNGWITVTNSSFLSNTATTSEGGGIEHAGLFLTVSDSTFTGNSANYGGAIAMIIGPLTVTGSTFDSNTASSGGGGAIVSFDKLTVSNSTFYGNSAAQGGAIMNWFLGTSLGNVVNSTFSGNSANTNSGGAIYNGNTFTITNAIVANSPTGGNCAGNAITDGGNNLQFNPNSGCASIASGDPKLLPLANNGGSTRTMALMPGSAALNVGSNSVCAAAPVNNLDQRGFTRPVSGTCDIGAFEGMLSLNYFPLIFR